MDPMDFDNDEEDVLAFEKPLVNDGKLVKDHIKEPYYGRGVPASAKKLHELKFDPLEAMVKLYDKLLEEEKIYCTIRDGKRHMVTQDGKVRSVKYSAVSHASILSQLEKVAADLLRYKYGRVPETVDVAHHDVGGLIINLGVDQYDHE